MLKKILIGLVILVLAVCLGAQLLPSHWSVTRSIVINAKPAKITPLVADLKAGWPRWSSFDDEDPGIVYSYPNPKPGVGSERAWTSKKMGNGSQRITQANDQGVGFTLDMPDYNVHLSGSLAYSPEGSATRVTWTDEGEVGRNPMQRIMMRFMDKMMGPQFEKSLAKLKENVEAAPSAKK